MMDYASLSQQIKEFVSLHINDSFNKLSLQNLVKCEDHSLLLSSSCRWDLEFSHLGRVAVGLQNSENEPSSPQIKITLIDNLASLAVLSCGACSSTPEIALPAAAAMDIILMAAGLFDDIQDQDKSNSLVAKVGIGQTLNIALTLLLLGQNLLTKTLKEDLPETAAFELINRLNHCLLVGIKGQMLDLQETQVPLQARLENSDFYLVKTGIKAATIFSYLTELGATLGFKDHNHKLVSSYCQFGFAVGMVAQLIADLGDFLDSGKSPDKGRDLRNRMPTLPTVYAYLALEPEIKRQTFLTLWQRVPVPLEEIMQLIKPTPAVSQTVGQITRYTVEAESFLRVVDPELEKVEHRAMLNLLYTFVGSLKGLFLQAGF